MPRRDILRALTRALEEQQLPHAPAEDGAPGVEFAHVAGPFSLHISAYVLPDELVVFYLNTGLTIPVARWRAVSRWIHEANAHTPVCTFELDEEQRTIFVRHAVECTPLPMPVLSRALAHAWNTLAEIWLSRTPELLQVVASEEDVDDVPDETDAGEEPEDGDASDGPEADDDAAALPSIALGDTGPGAAGERWPDAAAEDGAANVLFEHLGLAIANRFDDALAEAMSGALGNLAETYVARMAASHPAPAEARVRVRGDDERAVLTVSAQGVAPLRLRFSPRAIRDGIDRDAHGLTLYYHARPDEVPRVLADGFTDDESSVPLRYSTDEQGVPMSESADEVVTGVPLTSAPLTLDDRGARVRVLRIEWGAGAPSLLEYERLETAYTDTDAWVVQGPLRRWHVPAEVLNAAVASGLAQVTPVD